MGAECLGQSVGRKVKSVGDSEWGGGGGQIVGASVGRGGGCRVCVEEGGGRVCVCGGGGGGGGGVGGQCWGGRVCVGRVRGEVVCDSMSLTHPHRVSGKSVGDSEWGGGADCRGQCWGRGGGRGMQGVCRGGGR